MLLSRRTGEAVGLVMPKVIGHKDIHHLYSPKSRRSHFPKANWHFLVRAAANLARAVASVHEAGCVIGDVNPSGILVSQDAQVRLIDCDSFQISAEGRQFLCHVGVPHFTPPELQKRDLTGVVRTTDHDNFGLAVMVFLLLFMGRHPFAGRFLGRGDMPIEQAIAEYRFVYGANRASSQMEQPPGTPSLDIASPGVALLLERALAATTPPGGRPTALDWIAGLEALEKKLTQCPFSSSHVHLAGLPACPWCEMEARSRVPLFPVGPTRTNAGLLDLDELWKQVAAIPHPGPTPLVEDPALAQALPPGRDVRKLKLKRASRPVLTALLVAGLPALMAPYVIVEAAAASAIAGMAASVFIWRGLGGRGQIASLVEARARAEERWKEVGQHWNERAGSHHFERKRLEVDELGRKLESLPGERLARLNDLMARRQETQLEAFLDRFAIPAKGLAGIWPARQATLDHGIETAADIGHQTLMAVLASAGPIGGAGELAQDPRRDFASTRRRASIRGAGSQAGIWGSTKPWSANCSRPLELKQIHDQTTSMHTQNLIDSDTGSMCRP